MRMLRRERLRPLGGAVGIVIALAGGFGAAVGFYSLPDPRGASVSAYVYARAVQQAVAVFRQDYEGGSSVLRIDVNRGGSVEGDGYVSEFSQNTVSHTDTHAYFQASLETCTWGNDDCEWQTWESRIPRKAFHFSPVMRNARFTGVVDGCRFNVEWRGEGLIAPFSNFFATPGLGPWGAGTDVDGHGVISREAPASIQACFVSARRANGFLSQGIFRTRDRGHVSAG